MMVRSTRLSLYAVLGVVVAYLPRLEGRVVVGPDDLDSDTFAWSCSTVVSPSSSPFRYNSSVALLSEYENMRLVAVSLQMNVWV